MFFYLKQQLLKLLKDMEQLYQKAAWPNLSGYRFWPCGHFIQWRLEECWFQTLIMRSTWKSFEVCIDWSISARIRSRRVQNAKTSTKCIIQNICKMSKTSEMFLQRNVLVQERFRSVFFATKPENINVYRYKNTKNATES